jgi:hypothetical protein
MESCIKLTKGCCITQTYGLLHDTDIWAVAWPLTLGCCMTLTSVLLHEKNIWTVSWDWLLDWCMTTGLLHDTDLWTLVWHWPLHVAWQRHLNSCITRISVQFHDPDRWLDYCMTVTYGLLHDNNFLTAALFCWTVAWHWPLDCCMTMISGLYYDTLASTLYWTTTCRTFPRCVLLQNINPQNCTIQILGGH